MKLLRTVIVVLLLSQVSGSCQLFWGCDKENKLKQLTDESRQWMPYTLNAKLVFENASSPDTVFVTYYQEEIAPYFRGDECADGKMETVKAKLASKLFSDTISFELDFEDKVALENKDFLVEYHDSQNYLSAIDDSKRYHATLTIEQKTFTEAIVSKCSTCTGLTEVVFAKHLGLVAYKVGDIYWTRK